MDGLDKIFETMKDLGLNTKRLKRISLISEYCALITTLSNAAEDALINKGGAVLAKEEDLTSCIKFVQEKLSVCYEKGAEIIDLLKK